MRRIFRFSDRANENVNRKLYAESPFATHAIRWNGYDGAGLRVSQRNMRSSIDGGENASVRLFFSLSLSHTFFLFRLRVCTIGLFEVALVVQSPNRRTSNIVHKS